MKKIDNPSLPMPVKVRPYSHQQAAFDFACGKFGLLPSDSRSRGVALLMEMGCGKTLAAIGIAGILYQFGLVNKVLVVAPLSILGVWESEYEQYAEYPYTMTILQGTSDKKRKMLKEVSSDGLQIVVVNYESARILEKELLQFDADLIIADEGHKIKSHSSKQSKVMPRRRASYSRSRMSRQKIRMLRITRNAEQSRKIRISVRSTACSLEACSGH